MKSNVMVCALLACAVIVVYSCSRRGSRLCWAGAATTATVLMIASTTLAEYALGWRLGIDELLFHDWGTSRAPYSGRSAANAAVGFVLVSGGFPGQVW